MKRKDIEAFRKDVRALLVKYKMEEEGQALMLFYGDDGTFMYTGYGCAVCIAQVLFNQIEIGRIVHVGTKEELDSTTKH
jgi:hypothetical protein